MSESWKETDVWAEIKALAAHGKIEVTKNRIVFLAEEGEGDNGIRLAFDENKETLEETMEEIKDKLVRICNVASNILDTLNVGPND